MALKAGYIGIKKTMLGLINSLASAKLIKSFGDGLNFTSAGKLNITAATASKIGGVKVGDGLSIADGVLNCNAVGDIYDDSDEITVYEAGKYIDASGNEKTYYRATVHFNSLTAGNWNRKALTGVNIGKVLSLNACIHTVANGDWSLGYRDNTKYFMSVYDNTLGASLYLSSDSIFTGATAEIFIDFVESEEE